MKYIIFFILVFFNNHLYGEEETTDEYIKDKRNNHCRIQRDSPFFTENPLHYKDLFAGVGILSAGIGGVIAWVSNHEEHYYAQRFAKLMGSQKEIKIPLKQKLWMFSWYIGKMNLVTLTTTTSFLLGFDVVRGIRGKLPLNKKG